MFEEKEGFKPGTRAYWRPLDSSDRACGLEGRVGLPRHPWKGIHHLRAGQFPRQMPGGSAVQRTPPSHSVTPGQQSPLPSRGSNALQSCSWSAPDPGTLSPQDALEGPLPSLRAPRVLNVFDG